jgi:predicted permease
MEQSRTFNELAGFNFHYATLTGDGLAERLLGSVVTSNFFPTLGVLPTLGSGFTAEHEHLGSNHVVILSHGLWQRRYGGDPDIVGRTIQVDGMPHTVLGVMPAEYRHPDTNAKFYQSELWQPLVLDEYRENRSGHWMRVLGRLAPGVKLEQARVEMEGIAARLAVVYPETNERWGVLVRPLAAELFADSRPALLMLLAVAGLVLLIVCVNTANLFLARSHGRSREFAVRAALGSGMPRLVRQLLVEGLVVSLAGGLIGIVVTGLGIEALRRMQMQYFPSIAEVGIDFRVVGFTILLCALTTLVFSFLPALSASRLSLSSVLAEGSDRSGRGAAAAHTRELLVMAEVALAAVLLIGAGLLTRSFVELVSVPPGFAADNRLLFQLTADVERHPEREELDLFWTDVIDRLNALPGVEGTAIASDMPFTIWNSYMSFFAVGQDYTDRGYPNTEFRIVSPGYFDVMNIPVVAGRTFSRGDRQEAHQVILVNEQLAALIWPDSNPLGQSIQYGAMEGPVTATVVGLVADILDDGLDSQAEPRLYFSTFQRPQRSMNVVMGTSVEPSSLVPIVRSQIGALDNNVPVSDVSTLKSLVRESVARPRAAFLLSAVFGSLALILAAIGTYGVVTYSVSERTREIGVRIALGARATDVLRHVLARSLRITLVGVGLGLAAALLLGRALSGLLFGISPGDPVTLAVSLAVLIGVAVLAAYVPARQATRVDPMVAMRYE